jgi:glutathione S-transferase
MASPQIILFTYDISVFGRKLEWYLTLSGLPYMKCITLDRLPRPMLEKLNIQYRRIPILAIGRDIYCDSRLIIDKLEELFPDNRIGAKDPFTRGLEHLIENYIIDGGPFWRTSGLIPSTANVIKSKEWMEDRHKMTGRQFNADTLREGRPEALAHSRMYFDLMENELLVDGRHYLLDTPEPSLADIHAVWVFHWTIGKSMGMLDSLEQDTISEKVFPKTFA